MHVFQTIFYEGFFEKTTSLPRDLNSNYNNEELTILTIQPRNE